VCSSDLAVAAGPTFADLNAANPNFSNQLNQWVLARQAFGQNVTDWPSFRAHEIAIGAPDPGSLAPVGWAA